MAATANGAGKSLKAEAQWWRAPRPHVRYFVLQLAESHLTRPLFGQILPAHRATHVASDMIERTAHGGSETRSGAIPAGVSLKAVSGVSGEERAAIPKRTRVIDSG